MEKLTYNIWHDKNSKCGVGGIILKRDDNKYLNISFQGNLDLYFTIYSRNNGDREFIIGKDNMEIYNIFDTLFHRVINSLVYLPLIDFDIEIDDIDNDIWNREQFRMNMNEEFKNRDAYKSLVKDNTIIWKCDNYPKDIAPYFKIENKGNAYLISFASGNLIDNLSFNPSMISVRLRNSGSSYDPFNIIFMDAYNKLMELEPLYHQIHIEEYLIDEKLQKGVPLERILKK